jgi:hypothetical protein
MQAVASLRYGVIFKKAFSQQGKRMNHLCKGVPWVYGECGCPSRKKSS